MAAHVAQLVVRVLNLCFSEGLLQISRQQVLFLHRYSSVLIFCSSLFCSYFSILNLAQLFAVLSLERNFGLKCAFRTLSKSVMF